MNKTININLAGLFFHIDEDAYQRLQRYLAAVRRSFAGTSGAEEIMGDIESRIAELFLEKRANEQQVISINHVEEVISIMGQPEDYEVDEEIFEDQPNYKRAYKQPRNKQLFRDTQNGYVGGVSSGLGYYFGIEAVWVRVIWVILVFLSAGWIVPIYVLIWILAPDAVTTNQRLTMMGKEVNISNIGEENVKSGFESVADGETDAGHRIVGQKGKRGSIKFFNFLGRIIKGFFKAIAKLIGLFLFLGATIGLIALIISTITASVVSIEGHNLFTIFDLVVPVEQNTWWFVLALILAAGIPLLILAILGLKLLVSNLRSIGTTAKVVLVVLWVASVIVVTILVAQIAASQAVEGTHTTIEKFDINQEKVFQLNMNDDTYTDDMDNVQFRFDNMIIADFENGTERRLFDIKTAVAATPDSTAFARISYIARGASLKEAKENAKAIQHEVVINDSTMTIRDYYTLIEGARLNKQDVEITVYLPEGVKLRMNDAFASRYRSYISNDAFSLGSNSAYTYQVVDGKAVCLDCPIKKETQPEEEIKAGSSVIDMDEEPQDSTVTTDGKWEYQEDPI
ncbi:PspC domain-containing protein [Nonlabens xiamenensis]|uniref:PspC domain-containing protein n=1 Tax=Nonlabens xiamenensis TaxID=2341043 RepID=UPI000F606A99|nr:PspC domain-containing protein [Nonlabens xiamenensis]